MHIRMDKFMGYLTCCIISWSKVFHSVVNANISGLNSSQSFMKAEASRERNQISHCATARFSHIHRAIVHPKNRSTALLLHLHGNFTPINTSIPRLEERKYRPS